MNGTHCGRKLLYESTLDGVAMMMILRFRICHRVLGRYVSGAGIYCGCGLSAHFGLPS